MYCLVIIFHFEYSYPRLHKNIQYYKKIDHKLPIKKKTDLRLNIVYFSWLIKQMRITHIASALRFLNTYSNLGTVSPHFDVVKTVKKLDTRAFKPWDTAATAAAAVTHPHPSQGTGS